MLVNFEKHAFLPVQSAKSSLRERAEKKKIITGGEDDIEGTRVASRSGSGEDKASPGS